MTYSFLRAFHLIFIVTWFAGLFYIVRLFIYHTEAQEKPNSEKEILSNQFLIMQRRLWLGITWPSLILTLIFGSSLMILTELWDQQWFIIKLVFVGILMAYHIYNHKIYQDLQKGRFYKSSQWLRIWNEVATILLFIIVFLAVMKNTLGLWHAIFGILIISILIFGGVLIYKRVLKK